MKNRLILYHLMALLTISIWGTTFVSTKILLRSFSPVEVMFYRFVITYITLLVIYPKLQWTSLKDEGMFVLLGIFGGSLYFLTENIALHFTLATHVGFLLATAPILTTFAAHFLTKDEKMHHNIWAGFITAMAGVFLVVFNGSFTLQLSRFGELLALASALSWALYSVLLKKLGDKFTPIYTTRKVFFYGMITITPLYFKSDYKAHFSHLMRGEVIFNLLFLGLAASAMGFILWNIVIKKLGAVKTNNYIYLNPIITLAASAWLLKERITPYAAAGSLLIVIGVYLSQNKRIKPL